MRRASEAGCSRASSSSPKAADALRSNSIDCPVSIEPAARTNPSWRVVDAGASQRCTWRNAQPVRMRSPGKALARSTPLKVGPLVTTTSGSGLIPTSPADG